MKHPYETSSEANGLLNWKAHKITRFVGFELYNYIGMLNTNYFWFNKSRELLNPEETLASVKEEQEEFEHLNELLNDYQD